MEAIGLNPIRLDAIGIDPIRLNAIRLGVLGASSGSDRPYIAPEVLASLVAVVKCDGKSNNDPDRAIIKNLVDPDNPFVISNAAYKLNSGFGKYEISFKEGYRYNNSVVKDITDESFNFDTEVLIALLYKNIKVGESNDEPSYKIKVSNLSGKLRYYYINDKGSRVYIEFTSNGEYTLPISYDSLAIENTWIGFSSYSASSGTITQIPSFQGALVTDGVDDSIVSQKTVQEMLGGSTECTVVTMMWNLTNNNKYTYNNQIRPYVEGFIRDRFINNSGGKLSISGYTIKNINYNASIPASNTTDVKYILGDKNDFGREINNGKLDGVFSVEGYKFNNGTIGECSQVAWYWTFIAKKALTTDEINQVIAYYNLDKYVKPDIYYDVKKQGLSNDTPDADWYLKDFSGNGRDMQLYNFAKKLDSGIGKYNEDFKTWFQMTNGTAIISHDKLRVNKVSDINGGNFIAWKQSEIKAFKAKITGIPRNANILYLYSREGSVRESITIDTDREYDLPYSHSYASGVGFAINGNFPKEAYIGVTIEQIPDYEGALVSDAVEDYGQFVGDLGLKDYTIAVDRAYIEAKGTQVPIISNVVDGSVKTPFLMEHLGIEKILAPHSFGTYTALSELNINRFISYQSTYKYNGIDIIKGTSTNTGSGLTIGRIGGVNNQYANIALWSLLLFPYTLSEFLLERQLKRYKLGTLYPDMVEFRPITKSNIPYKQIDYFIRRSGTYVKLNPGDYFQSTEDIIVRVTPIRDWQLDVVSSIKVNGKDEVISVNSSYAQTNPIHIDKSPQKIDITIDEYIRYEDIVQPYPAIVNLRQNDKNITWGDKLKVGSEITFVNHSNLLPDLYTISDGVQYNGTSITWNTPIRVEKSMVFTNVHTYLKTNEPNCILAPQILRIPNSSYKILGYIPDLTGKGNHGIINNSVYAGMSGANGYKYDYETFLVDKVLARIDDYRRVTYFAAKNSVGFFDINSASYKGRIKLTGVKKAIDDKFIDVFRIYTNSPTNNEAIDIYEDGEYDVDIKGADDATRLFFFALTSLESTSTLNTPIVIEQIGEYEGSFCLDGVDDFITIPTLSHGAKQVLMKVNWQEINRISYDQRITSDFPYQFAIYTSNEDIAYNARNTNGKTYIDGILNNAIFATQLMNITHNITITNDVNVEDTQSPIIGSNNAHSANFAQMALFAFMSFDDISSEDEIKELNDIVGIEGGYVESPDYYWDAFGKSNLATLDIDYQDLFQSGNANKMLIDKSKAGLAALELYHNSGNNTELINRRLVANNFAFNEESGYSEIADTWLFKQWIPYGGTHYIEREQINNTTIRITKSNIASVDSFFARTNINKKAYYKITGLQQGQSIQFGYTNDIIYTAESDGVHEVDWSLTETRIYQELGCTFVGDCNITIEQVAQYQNGLVSDGVDDHLINTVIPAFTDFTVIAKRQFLNTELKLNETFCMKGDKSYSGGVGNAFIMEYFYGNDPTSKQTNMLSFGGSNIVPREESDVSWCTPTNYNGIKINRGEGGDTVGLMIGKYGNTYWKGVFYKMMLYSKTIDQLSINMLKNLFEKDELIDVNNPIFKQNN